MTCHTAWVQTFTGRAVDLLDPDPETIDIRDIAHGLALQCRFKGAVRKFYSVAQHSVDVALYVQDFSPLPLNKERLQQKLAALLHDAHEAYLGDLPAPVKHIPAVREIWMPIEQRLDEAICRRFDVDLAAHHDMIKEADLYCLAREKYALMSVEPRPWSALPRLRPGDLGPVEFWSPEEAELEFLRGFEKLTRSIDLARR